MRPLSILCLCLAVFAGCGEGKKEATGSITFDSVPLAQGDDFQITDKTVKFVFSNDEVGRALMQYLDRNRDVGLDGAYDFSVRKTGPYVTMYCTPHVDSKESPYHEQ